MSVKINPNLKLRLLWLMIGYALVALVVYLSLTGDPVDTGMSFLYQDKFFHALAYFVLMCWFAQIYHADAKRNFIAIVLIAVGVSLEFLQSLNPVRFYEFADMLANSTGVVLAYFLTLTNAKNYLFKFESCLNLKK